VEPLGSELKREIYFSQGIDLSTGIYFSSRDMISYDVILARTFETEPFILYMSGHSIDVEQRARPSGPRDASN
jgi:hypothetical protein